MSSVDNKRRRAGQQVRVKRETISDRHQYGDSFKVTFYAKDEGKTTEFSRKSLKDFFESKALPENAFLKVPWWERSLRNDSSRLEEEIQKEISNINSINSAKQRIEEHNRREAGKKSYPHRFNIAKMLGQNPPSRGEAKELIGVFYEYVDGNDLDKDKFQAAIESIHDSWDLLAFARQFAFAVQKIHNQSIAHSFIVPRNIIVSGIHGKKEFYIVGFGYARLGDTIGRDRYHYKIDDSDKLFLAPECKTKNKYGPFWFPADIYSIGAILYALLCYHGFHNNNIKNCAEDRESELKILLESVLKHPPRDIARLKRLIRTNLQKAAGTIIDQNENILKIIDHCLRYRPEDRFSCAEELIELIEIALRAESVDRDKTTKISPVQPARDIEVARKLIMTGANQLLLGKALLSPNSEAPKAAEKRDFSENGFFLELVNEMQGDFRTDLIKMQSGHLEIYGNRDKIITSLCRMLCVSKRGFKYNTMTIPHYWLEENLGPLGRFLTMNKHMARHGLKIKRMFLVDTDNFHLLDSDEQQMLLDHLEAQKDVTERIGAAEKAGAGKFAPGKGEESGEFDVRVLVVSAAEINTFERDGKTVGYLEPSKSIPSQPDASSRLCLSFYSSTSSEWDYGKEYVSRRISKVRFWAPGEDKEKSKKFEDSKKFFNEYWDHAYPLESYIGKGFSRREIPKGGGVTVAAITPDTISLEDLLKNRA